MPSPNEFAENLQKKHPGITAGHKPHAKKRYLHALFDPSKEPIKSKFREIAKDHSLQKDEIRKFLTLHYQAPIAEQIAIFFKKYFFNDYLNSIKIAEYCKAIQDLANDSTLM